MRDYRLDRLRLLLMVLVVFGHLLELFPGAEKLYRVIYSFHMPAFLFLSGYFARLDLRRLWPQLLRPYLLFQLLFPLCDTLLFGYRFTFHLLLPYWICWYLLTLATCLLLTKLLDKVRWEVGLMACVGVCLVWGYADWIGYVLSLGRTLTFLPFFAAGFYARGRLPRQFPACLRWGFRILAAGAGILIASRAEITKYMLYGSYSYAAAGYGIGVKALLLGIGFVWIGALWTLPLSRKPGYLARLGQNTMSIYLFHGLAIRVLRYFSPFGRNLAGNLLLALLCSVLLVLLFGSRYAASAMRFLQRSRKKT